MSTRGHHRGESRTSPRRLASAQQQRQAMEMRLAGATYQQIAETMKRPDGRPIFGDESGARHTVERAMRAIIREPAMELIAMELERLDRLWRAVAVRAWQGDNAAVDRALKIMDRRASLLGLDAPKRAPVDGDGKAVDGWNVTVVYQQPGTPQLTTMAATANGRADSPAGPA